MPDVNQLFRDATQHVRPATGALGRQLERQRRQARNRKMSALAVAAIIVAAIALFAANALNRSKDGSAPAVPPGGSGFNFTVVGTDGSVRSVVPVPFGALHSDVSPDGTRIAFVIKPGADSRIATMLMDGTQLRIITSDSVVADRPRWSPDGTELLFWEGSDLDNSLRLMVMNADGTNMREIPGTQSPANVPADWSPDGALILYASIEDGSDGAWWDLATVPADGGDSHVLADTRQVDDAPGTWSPDGSLIAFKRQDMFGAEIWLMNADGSGQHRLVSLPRRDAQAPEWSPDGSMIAFIGTVTGSEESPGANSAYVVDVATGDVTKILHGIANYATYDTRATWLPDSDSVLVLTETP